MKPQNPANRIRPAFMVLLLCVMAAVLIPAWMLTRSLLATKTPSPAPEPELAPPTFGPRVTPDHWQQKTTPPRGAAVSVPALMKQSARRSHPVKASPSPATGTAAATVEERWGIRVHGAVLSMGNAFLDLRYEIVDAKKAALLANGRTPAYVMEYETGAKLPMTAPPKEGCFPPTGNRLATGRMYSATIGNKGAVFKSGSYVCVLVGDSTSTYLTID